jgi:hypothetical protein
VVGPDPGGLGNCGHGLIRHPGSALSAEGRPTPGALRVPWRSGSAGALAGSGV